ncbi:PTS glucose transporter subunit IIA [Paraglaciecola aquimarina]|uniref:PTS system glucose-specific EIIA component n=1 Tax=Paraglaciecola aquimarina TaxID=1235557 RepID=A0ABU3SZU7_9ALTE|nr:PTS glucose transporter subunit IIA [Paraglaciecola aquimarina]MDU0355487.1 PTS glucose transporter subunit IIA [Paraglaciecola aquimarina]
MTLLGKLVGVDNLPTYKQILTIVSPLSGRAVSLSEVPNALFQQRLFGEGIAIIPSGFQVIAPFSGTVAACTELANQLRLKAQNGLQLQIQLGIDSHIMMGEGFKRKVKAGDTFKQGDVLAEFSLVKMKQQLPSILCPVTVINSEKVKAIRAHYYAVRASEDDILTVYI